MTRLIYSTARGTQNDVLDLLQGVFVAELLLPSGDLWFTSPWISDIAVLDNRTDEFTSLVNDWPPEHIRLSEVLAQLALRGTHIRLTTRPDEHGERWLQRLIQAGNRRSCLDHIHVRMSQALHEKGILSSSQYVSGSMNITYRGIHVNDEHLRFDTDPRILGEATLAFRRRWDLHPRSAAALP